MNYIRFQHEYSVQGYSTFDVEALSGDFSGRTKFCVAGSLLEDAVTALTNMYNDLSGQYQIDDGESDDYVGFELCALGHLKISGQLGGSYNDHCLKFQFMTDQTALRDIIKELTRPAVVEGTTP